MGDGVSVEQAGGEEAMIEERAMYLSARMSRIMRSLTVSSYDSSCV